MQPSAVLIIGNQVQHAIFGKPGAIAIRDPVPSFIIYMLPGIFKTSYRFDGNITKIGHAVMSRCKRFLFYNRNIIERLLFASSLCMQGNTGDNKYQTGHEG